MSADQFAKLLELPIFYYPNIPVLLEPESLSLWKMFTGKRNADNYLLQLPYTNGQIIICTDAFNHAIPLYLFIYIDILADGNGFNE